jgi:hypothetical protein
VSVRPISSGARNESEEPYRLSTPKPAWLRQGDDFAEIGKGSLVFGNVWMRHGTHPIVRLMHVPILPDYRFDRRPGHLSRNVPNDRDRGKNNSGSKRARQNGDDTKRGSITPSKSITSKALLPSARREEAIHWHHSVCAAGPGKLANLKATTDLYWRWHPDLRIGRFGGRRGTAAAERASDAMIRH